MTIEKYEKAKEILTRIDVYKDIERAVRNHLDIGGYIEIDNKLIYFPVDIFQYISKVASDRIDECEKELEEL